MGDGQIQPVWIHLHTNEIVRDVDLALEDPGERAKPPTTTTKRKRLRKGDAAIKIIAALESLAAAGEWDVNEGSIIARAGVERSTYYNVLKSNVGVRRVMREYRARRLGRGPVRADDL